MRDVSEINASTKFVMAPLVAKTIFGIFDKSQLIDIFNLILKGEETEVIKLYRNIYNQGIEPKVFINDFLKITT